jgi:hypothetical protein
VQGGNEREPVVQQDVAAVEVGAFVEEDEVEIVLGAGGEEMARKEKAGSEQAHERGTGQVVGQEEGEFSANVQGGAGGIEAGEEGRVRGDLGRAQDAPESEGGEEEAEQDGREAEEIEGREKGK